MISTSASRKGIKMHCSACGGEGHFRTTCGTGGDLAFQFGPSKICGLCYDLPHRRRKRGCPVCGAQYEPEPRVLIEHTPLRRFDSL